MSIKPLPGIVYLKMDKVEAGAFVVTKDTAIEVGEVIAVGEDCEHTDTFVACQKKDTECTRVFLKLGDKVFVKSWAVDTITYEDERYNFVNVSSGGILAVIE